MFFRTETEFPFETKEQKWIVHIRPEFSQQRYEANKIELSSKS